MVSGQDVLIENIPKESLSAREVRFPTGTLMSTTQVVIKGTDIVYRYHNINTEHYHIVVPNVGIVLPLTCSSVQKINYPKRSR